MRPLLLFLVGLLAACASADRRLVSRRAVVLTTDCGADMDDQWALAHLALSPELDLRAVVTTHAPNLEVGPALASETSRQVAAHVLDMVAPHSPRRPPVVAGLPDARGSGEGGEGARLLLALSRAHGPRDRLVVLVIGAATDTAAALRADPSLAGRIEVVAMAFDGWPEGGDAWNVRNDPKAWAVLLDSDVPITVGDAAVTRRDLLMTRRRAREVLAGAGPPGEYLVDVFERWLDRERPLVTRVSGRPDAWPVWDEVVVAHLLGMTESRLRPRPRLRDDLRFEHSTSATQKRTIRWVTRVYGDALWADLARKVEKAK